MKALSTLLLVCASTIAISQGISINSDGSPPDNSAVLDISDTDKGLLIPRITSNARTTMGSPAVGLLVYDLDDSTFYYNTATGWVSLRDARILTDADQDTKIQVEESADEDLIRFDIAGQEHWVMRPGRMEPVNNGKSVFLGEGAGLNDDFSDNGNTGVGYEAMNANNSGFSNTALGYRALFGNTNKVNNVAIGDSALFTNGSIGGGEIQASRNTALGSKAMVKNLTGRNNTALGFQALYSNVHGSDNVAVGYRALFHSDTNATFTEHNTAVGSEALYASVTGDNNTALGYHALFGNISGNSNVAVGFNSMSSNSDGDTNTGVGNVTLSSNTTGSENTGLGHSALSNNKTGSGNTAVGRLALFTDTIGNANTGVGYSALQTNSNGSNNTALGYEAGHNNLGSGNLFLGYQAGYSETGNNTLYIDNSNSASPLIYGDFDNDLINLNATVGIGVDNAESRLHLAGGNWNVATTEGDFKIGTADHRMVIGVATGAGGAGDVRIFAKGGTNRLFLGVSQSIVLAVKTFGVGVVSGGMHIGGSDDPGEANLLVDGDVTIAGAVSMTQRDVSFYAFNNSDDVIASNTNVKVEFNNQRHDDGGNNFDPVAHQFVAPDTGVYHFEAGVDFASLNDGTRVLVSLYKNGSQHVRIAGGYANTSNDFQIFGGSAVMELDAGDYVEVWVYATDTSPTVRGHPAGAVTYFSGHRLY